MAKAKRSEREKKLRCAMVILRSLHFAPKQSNEVAGYTLLACLDLKPGQSWNEAAAPLRGITPIIDFAATAFGVRYAPNTRETIRDEAVKYFVESGLLVRNPDDPARPTNSGKTVYQVEAQALEMLRTFDTPEWSDKLNAYLASRDRIRKKLERARKLARIPVKLPSGKTVTISPGGQNPLIRTVIEEFCPRFVAGGTVLYIGDAEDKFLHLDAEYLPDSESRFPRQQKCLTWSCMTRAAIGFCSSKPSRAPGQWIASDEGN